MDDNSNSSGLLRNRRAKDKTVKDNTNNKIKAFDTVKEAVEEIKRVERLNDKEPKPIVKIRQFDRVLQVEKSEESVDRFVVNVEFDVVAIGLFLVAFLTRTYKLSQPNDVVFDELHYGKYVSMYLKNTFFFDQHPPLGKQLVAGAAHFVGFKGNYTFSKIGSPYNEVK